MVETVESSTSSGFTPSHPEIPPYRMESISGTEHFEGFRGFWLVAGNITMAKAFSIVMDQGLLAMMELCASRGVSQDVFLDRLPPISYSTSEISIALSCHFALDLLSYKEGVHDFA